MERALERMSEIDRMGTLRVLAAAVLAAAVSACGGETGPRVYFDQPQDGATVSSPFEAVFGAEGVEIGAVPEEVDTPREGVVHYHLAADTECLPPGTQIPQADPWIHFGDGSNRIEMQLEPGQHRLVLQAGDDEHRTIEGLCQAITITVSEGGQG